MAKTRLNQGHKARLNLLAEKIVSVPTEGRAMDDAYRIAEILVRDCVATTYPPKDMKILRKYGVSSSRVKFKLVFPSGVVQEIKLRDGDEIDTPQYYGDKIFATDQNTADAVETYMIAKAAHDKALSAKFADYAGLIGAANYFEDIVEIWPEADQCRVSIAGEGRALSIVTPEVIGRIKADVASRAGHQMGAQ